MIDSTGQIKYKDSWLTRVVLFVDKKLWKYNENKENKLFKFFVLIRMWHFIRSYESSSSSASLTISRSRLDSSREGSSSITCNVPFSRVCGEIISFSSITLNRL